jgi:hypothetical protein
MYAVEFETVAQNGVIRIPTDYAEFASQPVKVVLMMDDAPKSVKVAKMQHQTSHNRLDYMRLRCHHLHTITEQKPMLYSLL